MVVLLAKIAKDLTSLYFDISVCLPLRWQFKEMKRAVSYAI